jgi:signal transduction histidine kinase/DNA-binding response OmpR family regulator
VTSPNRDRILIVESDPLICDVVSRQALQAVGYQTFVVGDASTAIGRVVQLVPDLIISDLNFPGLSGKDLMVALTSQGLNIPVIIIAQKGDEADIIHAFRVGAVDYMLWPSREAEIINVVERVLRQMHERREREQIQRKLQQTNQELQMRVRELTTIFSIGKAVTAITDHSLLFERILEDATKVTQAELGWFLMRENNAKTFRLVAQNNLPATMANQLNQAWDDGLSSLVGMSGETLSIHGEPLKRFKIFGLGQSALIVPVKAQKQVNGLLVCMRKQPVPFTLSDQHLLEAVADYASISLMNTQLFAEVKRRADRLESSVGQALTGEKINNQILDSVRDELRISIESAGSALDLLVKDPTSRWNPTHLQYISTLQEQLRNLGRVTEAITSTNEPLTTSPSSSPNNLTELVRRAASALQQVAHQNNVALSVEISGEFMPIQADAGQIFQVINGLLSNAIKFSNPGGQVIVRLEKTSDPAAHVIVSNSGQGIDPHQINSIFSPNFRALESQPHRFGGIGIRLGLIQEIVTSQKGKIWVESQPGQGSRFHFTIPLVK